MSLLQTLSRRFGIVDEYIDQSGTEHRTTSDATRVALLRAMGVDAGSEQDCAAALASMDAAARAEVRPPVSVVREREAARLAVRGGDGPWKLELHMEDGTERVVEGRGDGTADLGPLPLGYHDITVETRDRTTSHRRIVTPERCPTVEDVTGRPRAFGIFAQLYATRSKKNWGIGDSGDIDLLVDRAAAWGASFVGLNPLHALRNQGADISPYSPLSRLFGNWIYIDLASVPEHGSAEPADIETLRRATQLDYDRIAAYKRAALRRAYERFVQSGAPERRTAFATHRAQGGRDLEDFATFSVMSAAERAAHPVSDAAAIDAIRARRHDDVDFECWLQFELDRQLARSAARARERGLSIGLYQDLAIGCAPDGADVWAHRELFAPGVAIGAPPDSYSKEGQNWGLPPFDPHHLRAGGYRYWSTLLRRAFAHGGALRMDHVIGLFRQFWVPDGKSGKEGAFVTFPAEELLGILALEASRARAVVVGEDLGTVPENVPDVLARWGILSSRVLYFEVTNGEFNPSKSYASNALTTVNTHDMAPLAGWLEAADVALKERAGILSSGEAESARATRRDEVQALRRRLEEEGAGGRAAHGETFTRAVHGFLAHTPSALVGIALDDLTGETEPVNLPGTTPAQHPSWRRRYAVALEDLPDTPVALAPELRRRADGGNDAP